MGLDTASIKFLCGAKSFGVDFENTATLGRQSFFPDSASLAQVFKVHGIDKNVADCIRDNKFGDEFFELLGVKSLTSIDYSSYEEATLVHDMNEPIAPELRERFSFVYDGGTIEHVFNATQAFKNSMEMVEVGGHFAQVNIANNFMGHGFWQFSPELLFRMLSKENGYRVEALLLHEVKPGGRWFWVSDPDDVRQRVQLCNATPTYICTIAKRISKRDIFSSPPLQGYYQEAWSESNETQKEAVPLGLRASLKKGVKSLVPSPAKQLVKNVIRKNWALSDLSGGFKQTYYRQLKEAEVLRGNFK